MVTEDTIAAQATPAGRGGIGVVRISGEKAKKIGLRLTGIDLKPRHATYTPFLSKNGAIIDQGIAIYFPGPNSFTGEDVVEIQAHGGPFLLDDILKQCTHYGARIARPGEFSERAFLNDKIDLIQAEAIADLIEAGSRQAARLAVQSLQGVFSSNINQMKAQLIALRVYIEAAIDFPEEEIDFLADESIARDLARLETQLTSTLAEAQQGSIMREGIHAVIVGKPNAGKSSLLNALAGQQTAIVTHIEGTTRDVLRETIEIDGIPMHVTDTAGIRQAKDEVEHIGIQKALDEITRADLILLVIDAEQDVATDLDSLWPNDVPQPDVPVIILRNKIDLISENHGVLNETSLNISAKHNLGLDELKNRLKEIIGFQDNVQGKFMARRRHLSALERTEAGLLLAKQQLAAGAGELVAEELRLCQQYLSEITGEYTADDLLGEIFSSFCIGK